MVKCFADGCRPKRMGLKNGDSLGFKRNEALEGEQFAAVTGDLGITAEEGAIKSFKMTITKVGLVEKSALDEAFFKTAYPNNEITTEEDFRNTLKAEIENYYAQQSRNQIHDQLYHHFVDHTQMEFPASFLKRWLQTGGEKPKTAEEAEEDYPNFANQLKWTLISSKLIADNNIEVNPDDIKAFARQQLFGYMGMNALDTEQQPWVEDYVNRMMKDQKYVEDSYHRISTEKLFTLLEQKVQSTEEEISVEDFSAKLHHHH